MQLVAGSSTLSVFSQLYGSVPVDITSGEIGIFRAPVGFQDSANSTSLEIPIPTSLFSDWESETQLNATSDIIALIRDGSAYVSFSAFIGGTQQELLRGQLGICTCLESKLTGKNYIRWREAGFPEPFLSIADFAVASLIIGSANDFAVRVQV